MSFSTDLREELLNLKMWDTKSNLEDEEQIARLCLREAFIKSGFMTDPKKEYHLEMFFKTNKKAENIRQILEKFEIKSGITNKANGKIVYIKDGEEISKFLALVGANNAVLRFEETRVEKSARNSINRIVNCETANLGKIMNAANIQIENIKLLKEKNRFKDLPESLREIANLRLKNPDISYEELGALLKKPISKSGVSHRLNKINEIANELRGE